MSCNLTLILTNAVAHFHHYLSENKSEQLFPEEGMFWI